MEAAATVQLQLKRHEKGGTGTVEDAPLYLHDKANDLLRRPFSEAQGHGFTAMSVQHADLCGNMPGSDVAWSLHRTWPKAAQGDAQNCCASSNTLNALAIYMYPCPDSL